MNLISITEVEERDGLPNKDKLVDQVKSWLPHYHYIKQQSLNVAEQFIQKIADRYLKDNPASTNGQITLYDHYLDIIAEKK